VLRGDPRVTTVALAALALAAGAWLAAGIAGRRIVNRIGVEGLSMIGMVAGMHFAVSYVSRLGGGVLAALLGPFAIFVASLGSEGLVCLLLGVVVTLVPRVGTLAVSSLAVFVLNALVSGQLGLADVLYVTVSAALGEAALAALGVTTGAWRHRPAKRPGAAVVLRVALALGLANAATLYAQFCLTQVLFRLFYAGWYVAAVALLAGLCYGACGAALGALLGGELKRTMP
jgi:hypothetical protein